MYFAHICVFDFDSKPCFKQPLKRRPKEVFEIDNRLMRVKSIACIKHHMALSLLFCLFLSGCLRQVSLYAYCVLHVEEIFYSLPSVCFFVVDLYMIGFDSYHIIERGLSR